jgi:NAD(P)H-dependent FMN reductase
MKINIISGSTRPNSKSLEVSKYLSSRLTLLGVESSIVDLDEQRLPLFDASEEGDWSILWNKISQSLSESDGFIFVSPEWDGMMSVGLHNLLHYTEKELADKPVLLVGVSSGRGGRYPLQQMRIMGYKNKSFVVIPESLFYDMVKEALVDGVLTDSRSAERTDYVLRTLIEYAKALALVRASGVVDYEKFPNGL